MLYSHRTFFPRAPSGVIVRLYNMLSTTVVLFNFNRPHQTLRVLEQLTRLNCQRVYLVCDGPREGNLEDKVAVGEVLEHLSQWIPSAEKYVIASQLNLGLRERFYSALDYVFSRENAAIILEDDCAIDDSFFEFAETSLDFYHSDTTVGIVSAHNPMPCRQSSAVQFDTYPRIWGWATHGDLWRKFRSSPIPDYLDPKFRRSVLQMLGSRTMRLMFGSMMSPQFSSRTWDVDFATFCISEGLLNVYPPTNLCLNLGIHGNGTNSQDWSAVELPEPRPIKGPLHWREARKPSIWINAIVDLRRLFRWLEAALRHPALAGQKALRLLGQQ